MSTTHDDEESVKDDEWVYHEADETDTSESDDTPDPERTEPRTVLSKYFPRIEYDSEEKSVSITTRL